MNMERTQRLWDKIVTLDPRGLFATRPTISATTAVMRIAELYDVVEPGMFFLFFEFQIHKNSYFFI